MSGHDRSRAQVARLLVPTSAEPGRAPGALGHAEIALLFLALALRGAYVSAVDTTLWFDHVFNDATAMGLLEGRGFTVSLVPPYAPGIFRTPGYPAFLALVYGAVGHSVRAGLWAHALLDTASCWLLFRLAARRVAPGAARAVLLLAATYPFFVHATGLLSTETLSTFLCLVLLAAFEAWPMERGWGRVVAAGVVLALLGWVKPVFLVLPPFLVVAERARGRSWRTSVTRCAVVGGLAIAAIAPWAARNQQQLGRPVLAGELGIVVWHGTLDFEDGRDPATRASFDRAQSRRSVHYEDARAWYADPVAELAQSDEYVRAAFDRMRARPFGAFVLDPLRRVPRLWISTSYAIGPRWVGAGAAAACAGYLLLAVVGLVRLRHRLRELAAWWVLPIQLTLVYAALHVEARYTLPARATLLLLAGVGLQSLWERSGRIGASSRC